MGKQTDDGKSWVYFDEGDLKDISLYTTEDYAKLLYGSGNTDPEMMASIKANNPAGKTVFDVGAFIGASSLVFSKLIGEKGKVIAFEPNPYNAARLEKILQKNKKYSSNIQVYPYALSDSNTTLQLHLSEAIDNGHSSTSRIEGSHSTIHDGDLPEGFRNVEVEAMTLDSFVAQKKITPDILKVDIEGAEYEFLLGAVGTIRKSHPAFYIEFHSPFCAAKCTELLVREGYDIDVIHEEEDNRVMVFAEYVDSKSTTGADVDKLKSVNNIFSVLKATSDNLTRITAELQAKGLENSALIKENAALQQLVDNLESKNQTLMNGLEAFESSLSWKVTKPLRKTRAALKGIKVSNKDE